MVVLAFAGINLIPDGTLLIHIALILLMIWLLNRTFFRPINKVIESREKNSGGRNTEAKEILIRVQDKKAAYDSAIRGARDEGYKLVEKQRSEAISDRQNRIDTVKEEVADLLTSEKDEITKQSEKARGEIAKEAQTLAQKITANLLKT